MYNNNEIAWGSIGADDEYDLSGDGDEYEDEYDVSGDGDEYDDEYEVSADDEWSSDLELLAGDLFEGDDTDEWAFVNVGEDVGMASWGTLGKDHRVKADISWSGDSDEVETFEPPILGWNPFKAIKKTAKKVARGAKNLAKNPVKFSTRGIQNLAHTASTAGRTAAHAAKVATPYLAAAAVGVSFVCPVAAPLAISAVAASKLISIADKKIPSIPAAKRGTPAAKKVEKAAKKKTAAIKVIKATVAKAKKGDKKAKRTVAILKAVKTSRNAAIARGRKVAFTADRKGFAIRVA